LYYGDEIGMGDDILRPDRDGVRSPMQWDASRKAGFTTSDHPFAALIDSEEYSSQRVNVAAAQKDQQSLWNHIRHLIRLRKEHPVLATGKFENITGLPESVGGYYRSDGNEKLLVLNNLSDETQHPSLELAGADEIVDLVSGDTFQVKHGSLTISMQAHEFFWFRMA
jgi:maltose alpha-D-glucosyltransferase/alpha-amylase